jgi:hypothetical protein
MPYDDVVIMRDGGEEMKRLFAAVALGAVMVIPVGGAVAPSASASPLGQGAGPGPCPPPAKAYKCKTGTQIIGTGSIHLDLASTSITLTGTATRNTLGTEMYLARVVARGVPKHAVAFKVFASGRIPALHLAGKGSLFQLTVATGKWTSIKAITRTGIYAAIRG